MLATALLFSAATANAQLLSISGVASTNVPIGDPLNQNNVLNRPLTNTSGFENNPPSTQLWYATPTSALSTTQADVVLDWYFIGSESGYTNTLKSGPADAIDYTEQNTIGLFGLGSYTQTTQGNVDMRFTGGDAPVENGITTGGGFPGITFAYVSGSLATGWTFSAAATDTVIFGLNDNNVGGDDNHDDWMGVVVASPVPVPAALPLFLSALAGLGIFGRRKQAA